MTIKAWLLGLLGSFMLVAPAQTFLPNDPEVRLGKLSNGLTYYIRKNQWPENRVNFYIVQKVGSLQEEDHQRGLAHFLEHMCFNGSQHFVGNDLQRYCESIGVQYGTDLNAYTGMDQTVYNINNVPATNLRAVDSCLIILRDWAGALTLDSQEIDQERGVIYEEWRTTTNSYQRMMERALPKIYGKSRYAYRMPIGTMEVVQNFQPKALRDYYEKWYRPDNQGIIVVGDVDVEVIEKRIVQLFADLKLAPNRSIVTPIPVPDNASPIVVIEKDKEQTTNQVDLIFKQDLAPDTVKQSLAYLADNYVKGAVVALMNARFAEVAQKTDCPFFGAQMGNGYFIVSRTKGAYSISLAAKFGQTLAALRNAYAEALRAARFGFTNTEFERFKTNALASLERMYAMRDKRSHSQIAEDLKRHFLDHEAYLSVDVHYQAMLQILHSLKLEHLNQAVRQMVPERDENMVIVSFNHEGEGSVYPTEEKLLQSVQEARNLPLTPYVDQTKTEPLIAVLPQPGKIVKTQKSKLFDFETLTLSNGMKIHLKKTDYDKKTVLFMGECKGGSASYGLEDLMNVRLFNSVAATSALGAFTRSELSKTLAGKMVNVGLSMDEEKTYITGSAAPRDLETMFQLLYLSFTDVRKDTLSFERLLRKQITELQAKGIAAEEIFADSVTNTFYGHNPRLRPTELEDLQQVDNDRILQMIKIQTASPGAFELSFIGNFDTDSIRTLIERYLAALPKGKKPRALPRTSYYQKGEIANHFLRPMDTPKAQAVMMWHSNEMAYTQKNAILASVVGQILSTTFLEEIREKASAAYTVSARCNLMRHDDGKVVVTLSVDCPMKPEKADLAQTIMHREVGLLAKTCDPTLLDKVKQLMLKQNDDMVRTNGYWSSVITTYRKTGQNWHDQRKKIIADLQPQDVVAFMQEFLKAGNKIEISMRPE